MSRPTRHPSADALRKLASGTGSRAASAHVEGCAACRADVQLLWALAPERSLAPSTDCPSAADLVAAHRRELMAPQLATIVAHADGCLACAVALDVLAADADAGALPAEPSPLDRAAAAVATALASLARFELPAAVAFEARGAATEGDLGDALDAAREGRLEAAVAGLRAVLDRRGKDPVAHFHLGACLVAQGELGEGVRHLAESARLRRGFAEHAWLHAQALLLAGRGDEALAELRRCARLPGPRKEAARVLAADVARALEGR